MKTGSRRRTFVLWLAALGAGAALLAATASAGTAATARHAATPGHVTIAYQPGIGYAPLIVMKMQKTLEHQFPATDFSWQVLASGAAVTTGTIAGDIQIGAGGVGPLILGWAQGADLKMIAPLDWGDLWLMAKDPAIKKVADLKGKKVAMPSATSIQGVVLRMMAEKELGDSHALDSTMVSMDHPTGMQALLSGQIDGHLTSAPYQLQEKVRGAHIVARSETYFGKSSFLGAWMTSKFYDQYPHFAQVFYNDVAKAIALINTNPTKVSLMLSEDAGGSPSWRQFKQWFAASGLKFTTQPAGLMKFAVAMKEFGMISKLPGSWKSLVFPPVYGTKGS